MGKFFCLWFFFLAMSRFASPHYHIWPEMLYSFNCFFAKTKFCMKLFLCSAFSLALSGWMFLILGEHWMDDKK